MPFDVLVQRRLFQPEQAFPLADLLREGLLLPALRHQGDRALLVSWLAAALAVVQSRAQDAGRIMADSQTCSVNSTDPSGEEAGEDSSRQDQE